MAPQFARRSSLMVERPAGDGSNLTKDPLFAGGVVNRREFCLTSAAAAISGSAAALGCLSAAAQPQLPPQLRPVMPAASISNVRLHQFIFDHRYPAGRAFGAVAKSADSSAVIAAIDGDITALWQYSLRSQWSAGGGGAIAGMTTARTLFCLEQLARDHWMRVVIRAEHAISKGYETVHRVTATEPMIARMRWTLSDRAWPMKMPAVLAAYQGADAAPRMTREIGSARGRWPAMTDQALVSFVIA
jgi:hypothetical protein